MMKMSTQTRGKLLDWQRSALELGNSIGYKMADDRDVTDRALKDFIESLDSLKRRIERHISGGVE